MRRRRWALAVWAALALGVGWGALRVEIENSPEALFTRDADARRDYLSFRQTFGSDRMLRLTLSGAGLATSQGLEWMGELERELASRPETVATAGLSFYHRLLGYGWPPPSPPRALATFAAEPLPLAAGWIDRRGERAGILVVLWDLEPAELDTLLTFVERRIARAPPGIEVQLTGLPALERALDLEVRSFVARFLPWLLALAVVSLALAFRDAAAVAAALAYVAVCLAILVGALGWAGVALDMVLVVLLPLALVTALATAVHLLVRYRQIRGRQASPRAAVRATYGEKGWPLLWAGLTTAVGFGSLVVSRSPAVQTLGGWTAFAMVLITAAAFTLLPALLPVVGSTRPRQRGAAQPRQRGAAQPRLTERGLEGHGRRWGKTAAVWAARHRRGVTVGFVLVTAAALAGISNLGDEESVLTYLAPGHPLRAATESAERAGLPTASAQLVLRRNVTHHPPGVAHGDLDTPQAVTRLDELADTLRGLPNVSTVLGPGEVLDAALPEGPAGDRESFCHALGMLRGLPDTAPVFAALASRRGDAVQLAVGLPSAGPSVLAPTLSAIERRARAAFPEAEVFVTGQYPLMLAAQSGLLRTMVLSLGLTLLVVATVFAALLPGARPTLAALAPNLFPVAVAVGAVGWLRLPLDGSVVMIAAAVLGLAVDDTLHALGAVRRLAGRLSPRAAAVAALERTAPAHLLTTVLLAAGFGVCALSPFPVVARFGGVTAAALLAALAADLLLVPALVAGIDSRAWQRLARRAGLGRGLRRRGGGEPTTAP